MIKIYIEFLKIGAFSFGGGLSTLPYIYEMARKTSWITVDYVTKILTFSQITPGPLACNIGTIAGANANGLMGAFIANLGFITPAICFMGITYKFMNKIKGNKTIEKMMKTLRAAALAVVISSSLNLFKTTLYLEGGFLNINIKALILGIVIYFFSKYKKIKPIILISVSAIMAVIIRV